MRPPWRSNWAMPAGSLDRWPEDYERGRPDWPPGVVVVVGLPRASTVLDLGAGTGKLTRILVRAFDRVLAVEPADEMRSLLAKICPEAQPMAGSAEEIPLVDISVDAVFVAQAFHTFDDERALREIARVLRPGGAVVLLWNRPAGEWEPSAAAAEEILREWMPPEVPYIPLDLGGPAASSGWQPSVAESPLEPFRARVLPNPQTLDREGLVAFYATMGWLADLSDDKRMALLDAVRSRLADGAYRRLWEAHVHESRRPPEHT